MKKSLFKVGQTVYCLIFGEGKVVGIADEEENGITVELLGGGRASYTQEGEYYGGYNRVLFFSKPEVIAETEPPFEPTLVGKEILITAENCCLEVVTVHKETKDKIYITPEATRFYQKKDIRTIHILERVSI